MNKNKKIVIISTFADAHFIKCQIPNLIETINPDVIIYNEGLFKGGPEGDTQITKEFLDTYTINGTQGFDYKETESIVQDYQIKYPNTKIILHPMNYLNCSNNPVECFIKSMTSFHGYEPIDGDFIFPLEPDVFHRESDVYEIEGYLNQLKPDQGFRSIWIDFLENQYYAEKKNLTPVLENNLESGRSRRVCIRYKSREFYLSVLQNFLSQKYSMLFPTSLITFHYPWWKFGKYKELRFDMLNRSQKYKQDFKTGLDEISKVTKKDVVIRPDSPEKSKNRYASFIELEHPLAIQNHPNWKSRCV